MKNSPGFVMSRVIAMLITICSVTGISAQVKPSIDCPPNNIPNGNCNGALNGYISNFSTTGGSTNITNNGTNCGNANSYSDYTGTSMKVTQNAGSSITAKVTWVGENANFKLAYCRIYVDWNNNGSFDLPGEFVVLPNAPNSHQITSGATLNYNIPIPGYAKEGMLRMRVTTGALTLQTPDHNLSPCGTFGRGEIEDYTIEVINPCVPPDVISVSNLDFESGDFAWTQKLNAEFYEYIITPADTIPHDTVIGFTFTTDNTVDVDTFECDTKYYIMVRAICDTLGKAAIDWDKSAWRRDSFTTDPCCYDPQVTVDKVTHNTARASWNPVATALGYEYAATTLTTPPQKGTYTINNSVLLQGLSSKQTYFVYVRTRCTPTPLSDWTQTAFKTLKTTSVDELNGESFYIQAYPSPMQDVLNVNITGEINKNARISLVDLTGKVVYTASVTSNEVRIDASNFTSGIYIVKYTDDVHNKIMRVNK